MAAVRHCLEDAGLQVRAAKPGPDDDDVTVLYLPDAKRDTIENCVEA